jgi:hypothetical protein
MSQLRLDLVQRAPNIVGGTAAALAA